MFKFLQEKKQKYIKISLKPNWFPTLLLNKKQFKNLPKRLPAWIVCHYWKNYSRSDQNGLSNQEGSEKKKTTWVMLAAIQGGSDANYSCTTKTNA